MKPKMKRKITIAWSCGCVSGHEHKTKDSAQRCIDDHAGKQPRKPIHSQHNIMLALDLKNKGFNYGSISYQTGIPVSRINEMLHKAQRILHLVFGMKYPNGEWMKVPGKYWEME